MGGKDSNFGFDFPPNIGEFQDDILDAQEHNVSQADWGIPVIGKSHERIKVAANTTACYVIMYIQNDIMMFKNII